MTRGIGQRGPMCTLDAGDFAEQRPIVFVDDHHAVLSADEQTVVWWEFSVGARAQSG